MSKPTSVLRGQSGFSRLPAILALLGFACSVYDAPGNGGGGAPPSEMSGSAGASANQGGTATSAGGIGGGLGGQAVTAGQSGGAGRPTNGTGGTGTDVPGMAGGAAGIPATELGGAAAEGGAAGAGGLGEPPPPVDMCPDDAAKLVPGVCGCGIPENCQTLKAKLIHRYDFKGADAVVKDRVGTADGSVQGATLSGNGRLSLSGGTTGPYAVLPTTLISTLTNVTLEAWVTWHGGAAWQRVFDFGNTDGGATAYGKTYLFLTPQSSNSVATAGYSTTGSGGQLDAKATAGLVVNQTSHVAMVADDTGNQLILYVNGAAAGTATWTGSLSAITYVNCWLGRSQFDVNERLSGDIDEFRVYSAALSAAELATSFKAGPDPAFLAY